MTTNNITVIQGKLRIYFADESDWAARKAASAELEVASWIGAPVAGYRQVSYRQDERTMNWTLDGDDELVTDALAASDCHWLETLGPDSAKLRWEETGFWWQNTVFPG